MQWVEFPQNNYILVLGNTWKVMKGSSSSSKFVLTRYPISVLSLFLSSPCPSSLCLLGGRCLLSLRLVFPINWFGSSEYLGLLELTGDLIDWILDSSWQKF